MNVLELFSGTKSVGKCCNELGYNVISVDIERKSNPTHLCNILNFDYKQYDKNHFDIIWSSPPCTDYSALNRALPNKICNLDEADKLVKKSFEIINYFNPHWWFLENPQTGTLKDREIMINIPFYDVDYCRYSDWGYKKKTRIWTNKEDWDNKLCNKKCGNMIGNLHKNNLGNTERKKKSGGKSFTLQDRYRIPPDLIYSLLLE